MTPLPADPNGLLSMRARYYSPELRRFVNADPIGFEGGMYRYSYANNSPLKWVNPSGEVGVAAGAIIGASAGFMRRAAFGLSNTA